MITTDFIVVSPKFDEVIPQNLSPAEAVVYLALEKAKEVLHSHPNDTIIASDTIVELNGKIFGKPQDEEEAFFHLSSLSANTHNVHTGVAIISKDKAVSFCSTANVTFDKLSSEEIISYIKSGEPMDKAGSYGIQGLGGRFVSHINGDYYSIMGLPLNRVYREIAKLAND